VLHGAPTAGTDLSAPADASSTDASAAASAPRAMAAWRRRESGGRRRAESAAAARSAHARARALRSCERHGVRGARARAGRRCRRQRGARGRRLGGRRGAHLLVGTACACSRKRSLSAPRVLARPASRSAPAGAQARSTHAVRQQPARVAGARPAPASAQRPAQRRRRRRRLCDSRARYGRRTACRAAPRARAAQPAPPRPRPRPRRQRRDAASMAAGSAPGTAASWSAASGLVGRHHRTTRPARARWSDHEQQAAGPWGAAPPCGAARQAAAARALQARHTRHHACARARQGAG
jgi:hypothetical protein